jgi:hypothetical protein
MSMDMGSNIGRKALETRFEERWIPLPDGRNVYAHVHSPAEAGKYPGLVIVPGGMGAGLDYDNEEGLTADDLASFGFSVLHYDPSGRGRTGGEENYWGYVHQEEFFHVIEYFSELPSVDRECIGIVSFSIGVTIASGALARYPMEWVRFLFDLEGPSNRYNITLNDTLELFFGFPTSDMEFWKEREAARFIGDTKCGYFRYQAEEDHMQGNSKGHAKELLNLATKGRAAWTRCNDNPENTVFDEDRLEEYHWLSESESNKERIIKYLIDLSRKCTR